MWSLFLRNCAIEERLEGSRVSRLEYGGLHPNLKSVCVAWETLSTPLVSVLPLPLLQSRFNGLSPLTDMTSSIRHITDISDRVAVFVKVGFRDFPGGPVVRNAPANAGDAGSTPSLRRLHML